MTSDGTASGTHVYFDGQEVTDLFAVSFHVEVDQPMGQMEIQVRNVAFDLDSSMLNYQVIQEEPF